MSGIRELVLFKKVFTENSHEILQYLDTLDRSNLKACNKFLLDICQCYELLSCSINSLSKLFYTSVEVSYSNNVKNTVNIYEKTSITGLIWFN
jgi:hypothetical protein